jgi:hypothetical protein
MPLKSDAEDSISGGSFPANHFSKLRRLRGNMTKLRQFLAGKTYATFSLLRAVRLREAPCVLLGFIVMLLISPEKELPQSPESKEYARRRNASK